VFGSVSKHLDERLDRARIALPAECPDCRVTDTAPSVSERLDDRFDRPFVSQFAERLDRCASDTTVLVPEHRHKRFNCTHVASSAEYLGDHASDVGVPVFERLDDKCLHGACIAQSTEHESYCALGILASATEHLDQHFDSTGIFVLSQTLPVPVLAADCSLPAWLTQFAESLDHCASDIADRITERLDKRLDRARVTQFAE
jgi:hypothetical protein